jgi:hypothetical protein
VGSALSFGGLASGAEGPTEDGEEGTEGEIEVSEGAELDGGNTEPSEGGEAEGARVEKGAEEPEVGEEEPEVGEGAGGGGAADKLFLTLLNNSFGLNVDVNKGGAAGSVTGFLFVGGGDGTSSSIGDCTPDVAFDFCVDLSPHGMS